MPTPMAPVPRTPLLFLFLLYLPILPKPVSSQVNISFDFPSFSLRNLTLLGDSHLRNGSVFLTKETPVPTSSSGAAIFNHPIPFRNPTTNTSTSFFTKFSFAITNPNPKAHGGDGLTFFVSPENQMLGTTGAHLGLFNSLNTIKNGSTVVAVEFDTRLDQEFDDPSPNHIGLDISGPKSVKVINLGPRGIELKSGNFITAWIEYHQSKKRLKVWLSYSTEKPKKALLSTRFDLSKYFNEQMYVGFSASAENSTEVHLIESWSFQTLNLLPTLYNFSDTSWSKIPPIHNSRHSNNSHKNLALGLGIIGPSAFFAAFLVFLYVSLKKRKKGMEFSSNLNQNSFPRQFRYRELSSATRGFHGSRIIGSGAFGTVYRAVDSKSGGNYAVKRSKRSQESKNEFVAELSIIARLQHKNLVQLHGWCTEHDELLLVYEFMPNGSLDRFLHPGPNSGPCPTLNWAQRHNIAIGLASVLVYLHQDCDHRVIHRDIKTSNVLLDANFEPRLGDFGLARLMEHGKSPVSTLTAGTMGYLAPEYIQYGKATEKSDVYSYGVVVLEVCSGRRPIDREDGEVNKLVNLVDWVWGLYSEDRLIEAVDRRLGGEFNRGEMVRLLVVGLSCANPNSVERPSMRRVVQVFKGVAEPVAVPKVKPCPVFASSSASLTLEEIVSECGGQEIISESSSQLYEVSIS